MKRGDTVLIVDFKRKAFVNDRIHLAGSEGLYTMSETPGGKPIGAHYRSISAIAAYFYPQGLKPCRMLLTEKITDKK